MVARTWIRWLLPVWLLCGTARSALADGTSYVGEGMGWMLLAFAGLAVLAPVPLVLLGWLVRKAVLRRRRAKAAASAIPTARAVSDRHEPG